MLRGLSLFIPSVREGQGKLREINTFDLGFHPKTIRGPLRGSGRVSVFIESNDIKFTENNDLRDVITIKSFLSIITRL